jgi:hypothetical protein
MTKQQNKKKNDHRGRALHTAKKPFVVCYCPQRMAKMVGRTTWEVSLPCALALAHGKGFFLFF